jgi:ketosteroid isomerase-like protein
VIRALSLALVLAWAGPAVAQRLPRSSAPMPQLLEQAQSLRADMDGFFAAYAKAFQGYDAAGVTALWAFPALASAPERSAAFATPEAFRVNVEALAAFYRRQGMARVAAQVLEIQPHFDGVVHARVRYDLAKADGSAIAGWEHVYLLRRTPQGWRIVASIADGELEAWTARGTPLGR